MCQSSLCPPGHIGDKHQISLTKGGGAKAWEMARVKGGGGAWMLAPKRPLLGIRGTCVGVRKRQRSWLQLRQEVSVRLTEQCPPPLNPMASHGKGSLRLTLSIATLLPLRQRDTRKRLQGAKSMQQQQRGQTHGAADVGVTFVFVSAPSFSPSPSVCLQPGRSVIRRQNKSALAQQGA